jgi:hypothetical protein
METEYSSVARPHDPVRLLEPSTRDHGRHGGPRELRGIGAGASAGVTDR